MLDTQATGVYLIAATPFTERGDLDLPGLDQLIDWYLDRGVDGLTILGQLGEAPKLTVDESTRDGRPRIRKYRPFQYDRSVADAHQHAEATE